MANNFNFTLDYAPSAVQHLGVGLYKQLPQALTELITNSWDADATKVMISIDYHERAISISDNGKGMNLNELNVDFLRVARNRRVNNNSDLSPKGRKVTGKKGLGKLALFGIADRIQVFSVQNKLKNAFEMNFKVIQNTNDNQKYHPKALIIDQPTEEVNGTTIIINDLTLKTISSMETLQSSLSKRFDKYSKENFCVTVKDNSNNTFILDESSFEKSIRPSSTEFTYIFPQDFTEELKKNTALKELQNRGISGKVFTKPTPLSANQQGFSILSRGKLASEHSITQFSNRANDRFYNYSTGYFDIDFIDDDLRNDYISTDRQSILWNSSEDLTHLQENLNKLIGVIQRKWRKDRNNRLEKKGKEVLHSGNVTKKIMESPNLTKKDKNTLTKISEILEKDGIEIPGKDKSTILNYVGLNTSTYQIDNSVYKELIPSNFIVPKSVDSKIRRLREESTLAATSADDPDKFILTQGLLLRALLDNTVSSLINKYFKEFREMNLLNNHTSTLQKANDLPLKEKFNAAIDFLNKKGRLHSQKNAAVIKAEFGNNHMTAKLDQLMHTPEQWPAFTDLKQMWDLLCPLFLIMFDFIKND